MVISGIHHDQSHLVTMSSSGPSGVIWTVLAIWCSLVGLTIITIYIKYCRRATTLFAESSRGRGLCRQCTAEGRSFVTADYGDKYGSVVVVRSCGKVQLFQCA